MEYTTEELYVEYMVDVIRTQGPDALVFDVGTKDNPQASTSDPIFNEWEKKLASGDPFDPLASLAADAQAEIKKFALRHKRKIAPEETASPEGFSDRYDGVP